MLHRIFIRPGLLQTAMLALMYAVLSIIILWPTVKPQSLYSTLPTGPTEVGTVPFFNTWTIWWNANRASHGFQYYWQAPIFYPVEGTFAFSEPQPATLIVAPIIWCGGSPVVAYKLYMLIALTLNGVFACRILRRFRLPLISAAIGGAAMVLLPIAHQQIDVLQLIPVWAILWTWQAFDSLCRRPCLSAAIQSGAAFGFCFWLSIHHGLFLSILLCGPVLAMPRKRWNLRLAGFGGLASGIAMVMILPLIVPIRHYLSQHQFERSDGTITGLSAHAADYLNIPGNSLLSENKLHGPGFQKSGRQLNPGWLRLAMVVPGIWFGLRRRKTRNLTVFLILTCLAAFVLSLGSHLQVGDWQIWPWLKDVIPGLAFVRSVFRFAYFVQMIAILLACCGLTYCWQMALRLITKSGKIGRRNPVINGIFLLMGALFIFEIPQATTTLVGVSGTKPNAAWINHAQQTLSPGRSLLCLPFAQGLGVRDLDISSRWMFLQTQHGLPMANGYSGFFPASWFQLQAALMTDTGSSPPRRSKTTPLHQLLQQAKVQLVVVAAGQFDISQLESALSSYATLQQTFGDQSGVNVYQIEWHQSPR